MGGDSSRIEHPGPNVNEQLVFDMLRNLKLTDILMYKLRNEVLVH